MINVDRLSFTYMKAPEPAVRGLGFRIEPGEIFGFLGPSGAGKSTTQKILTGLLRDYRGSVSIFDQDVAAWNSDFYERIGVSFEVPNHFLKLSGFENLSYFRSLYQGKTHPPHELLAMVGLEQDGDMLVSQYSKGMKNRLGVARSLLNDPELIFMDEPTAGLDPVNARRIRELILAQKRNGKTVFLTTHDMVTADQLCDRVAFIVDGEIKLIGSPRDLKLQHGEPRVRVEYLVNGTVEHCEYALWALGSNDEFLETLRTEDVQTIHTLEASLEEVFVQVTGRSLS